MLAVIQLFSALMFDFLHNRPVSSTTLTGEALETTDGANSDLPIESNSPRDAGVITPPLHYNKLTFSLLN